MPNMQVLCPCYKSNVALTLDRCVDVSLKFELNESIDKWSIKHLFHNFLTIVSLLIKFLSSNKF